MSLDLSKLSSAPWRVDKPRSACRIKSGDSFVMEQGVYGVRADADAAFIALARNAFDVMMRRSWHVIDTEDGWEVKSGDGCWWWPSLSPSTVTWPDPFTALVEADRWFRENVETEKTCDRPDR